MTMPPLLLWVPGSASHSEPVFKADPGKAPIELTPDVETYTFRCRSDSGIDIVPLFVAPILLPLFLRRSSELLLPHVVRSISINVWEDQIEDLRIP